MPLLRSLSGTRSPNQKFPIVPGRENTGNVTIKEEFKMSESVVNPLPTSFGGDLLDLPDLEDLGQREEEIKDEFRAALKFAFLGSGQAGGRLVETVYGLGYRRVGAINTASQDLDPVNLPKDRKFLLDIGEGGAGKDPAKGAEAIRSHRDQILDFMIGRFGHDVDRVFICFGAGGGSGTGSVTPLIELFPEYAEEVRRVSGKTPKIGVLTTFPRRNEGPRVAKNAHAVLSTLFEAAKAKKLSPLIVIDLERIQQIFPKIALATYWQKVNAHVLKLLHTFNCIADSPSPWTTFDRSELVHLLDSGVLTYGVTQFTSFDPVDMAKKVKESSERGLLARGYDWSVATAAAAIVVAGSGILASLPSEAIERVVGSFASSLGTRGKDFVLHQGLYQGKSEDVRIYTMIGGLGMPVERMRELASEASIAPLQTHDFNRGVESETTRGES